MAIISEWLKNDCADSITYVTGVIQQCVKMPQSETTKAFWQLPVYECRKKPSRPAWSRGFRALWDYPLISIFSPDLGSTVKWSHRGLGHGWWMAEMKIVFCPLLYTLEKGEKYPKSKVRGLAMEIRRDQTWFWWLAEAATIRNFRIVQTEEDFDEQLERIREIRASERKFYQKITDLYASAMNCGKLLL